MPRVAAPAPAITGDVVRLQWSVLADAEQNLFSMDYMANLFSPSLATDAAALASLVAAATFPQLKNVLSTDCTLEALTAIIISRADVAAQVVVTGAGAGSVMGGHIPKTMATRIRKNSTLKGAHGRGGLSVGPVPATFVTPGTNANSINAAAILAYAPFVNQLALPVAIIVGSGATYAPCVSTRPGLGVNVVSHAQPISNCTLDFVLGTVKRRRPGRGI